ncbi:MAG: UDP-N-acetylmuramoyl-L-alanyl-D-glutamate--2,6-diaminopimelate ligase [Myxococcales bacterium]|nr:UDP-N-acetylmuramoyl-L-alanyl-D-glutamate--2,6-diaminopimelate ligase [Myxococcales bacterium]
MIRQAITLGQLLDGVTGEYSGCVPETAVVDVHVDSRKVGPGTAFIAVSGSTGDGHAYVDAASRAGAAVIVLERGRCPRPLVPHVWIESTRAALPRLAANAYGWPARALRLAGVTGTNGKTTTSYLVAEVLTAAGRRHARLGTTGNWLVDHEAPASFTTPFPLELQGMLADARERGASDVIMEVSSHGLSQDRVAPLKFKGVALTSFSQDHLDYHPTMADYLAAKVRLARDYLEDRGVAIAASSAGAAAQAFLDAARERSALAWRATREPGERGELAVVSRDRSAPGIDVTLRTPVGSGRLQSPLLGDFNLDNLLVSVGLCLALGVRLATILEALRTAVGAPGRLERVQAPRGPAVFVDYAHTPDAVARALEALRPACRGALWVVLGCGGDRDPSKRPRMGQLAAEHADHFVATSDNPRTEEPRAIIDQMIAGVPAERRARLHVEVDRRRAIAHAIAAAADDDIILIAGKGHEDYQILGTTKVHLDDREEAARALGLR